MEGFPSCGAAMIFVNFAKRNSLEVSKGNYKASISILLLLL